MQVLYKKSLRGILNPDPTFKELMMTNALHIPIVELIHNALLIYQGQKEQFGKAAIMRLLTLLLRNHPVPQAVYDKVFRLALSDNLFENNAFVLYPRASRDAQALYRIRLIELGEWTRLQALTRDMRLPLSEEEILAVSRKICSSLNVIEVASFREFVRSHGTLPGVVKNMISCYFISVTTPRNAV